MVPYEHLERTSSTLDATVVTESLQFRERGLIHISDSAFNFFLALEQERVDRINLEKLRSHKTDLVDLALTEILQHEGLKQLFINLFDAADNDLVSNKLNW